MADTIVFQLKIQDDASAVLKKFNSELKKTQGIAERVLAGFTGIFVDGLRKTSRALFDLGVDSAKSFAKFEDGLIQVKKTANLTTEEMNQFGRILEETVLKPIDEFGVAGGIAINTLSEIAATGAQMGIAASSLDEFAVAIGKFQLASDVTASKAAENFGRILSILDLDISSNIEQAASSVVFLGNNMNTQESKILSAAQAMVDSFDGFKGSAENLFGLAAAVSSFSPQAQTAGNNVSAIFQIMSTRVNDFISVMGLSQEQGAEFVNLMNTDMVSALQFVLNEFGKIETPVAFNQALKDVGLSGRRVSQIFSSMTQNIDTVNTALKNSEEQYAAGTANTDEFKSAMEGFNNQWQSLKNILEILKNQIGGPIINAFNGLLKAINPILIDFTTWITRTQLIQKIMTPFLDEIKNRLVDLAQRAAVFVQGLDWHVIINKARVAFEGFKQVAAANFALINKALPVIWAGFEKLLEIIAKLPDTIGNTGDVFREFNNILTSQFEAVINLALKIKDTVVDVFNSTAMAIKKVIDPLGTMGEVMDKIIGKLVQMGVVAYEKSTFPDMDMWIKKTTESQDGLTNSIIGSNSALKKMGNQVNTSGQIFGSSGMATFAGTTAGKTMLPVGLIDPTTRARTQPNTSGISPAIQQQWPIQPLRPEPETRSQAGRLGEGGLTINLNGTNVVDEFSLGALADQITRKQAENSGKFSGLGGVN